MVTIIIVIMIDIISDSYTGKEVWLSWVTHDTPIEYIKDHIQLSGFDVMNVTGKTIIRQYSNGGRLMSLDSPVIRVKVYSILSQSKTS